MRYPAAKRIAVLIISLLYILLFVYASVSKLLDFENFQVQLGQSTLLGFFAGFVSYAVVVTELVIAGLLVFTVTRTLALYLGYSLMVLFTLYIYFILHYSSNVPCSCGGVIEKLSWDEHLLFNVGFVALGAIGLLLTCSLRSRSLKKTGVGLVSIIIGSIVFMTVLHFGSESIIHQHNNFTRRFPRGPLTQIGEIDLGYNSFYFAGQDTGQIYLGNYSAPLLVTGINRGGKVRQYHIRFHDSLTKFRSLQLEVRQSRFYLSDGTVPIIYSGYTYDWNVGKRFLLPKKFYFPVITNDSTMAFRTFGQSQENVLGTVNFRDGNGFRLHDRLLQKQIDGVFDTDGIPRYSESLGRYVYLYYYRNQFIVTDEALNLISRGNTIDTTSRAKIKVAYVKKRDERKFSAPPLMVNRLSDVHRNLLFVQSTMRGKHETEGMWRQANVVDVYDLRDNSYRMSFYLYKLDGTTDYDAFMVTDHHVYALVGEKLVVHRIEKSLLKEFDGLDDR
ncbi:DoxX family protein [Flavobacterium sp.]|uniref:DoxX family protein n=1 Tax=Flavobacterium sp. TaxID=239 RepID=UPI0039E261FB